MSARTYGMDARMHCPAPFCPARDSILTCIVDTVRVLPSTTDLQRGAAVAVGQLEEESPGPPQPKNRHRHAHTHNLGPSRLVNEQ